MRVRSILISLAAMPALIGVTPADAAPVVVVTGPLRPPGVFSEVGMHPVFDSCSFPTLDTVTSTTIVTFVIRKATHDGYFQATNRCGTYDEVFGIGECEREGTLWRCEHTRPDGFYAVAQWGVVNGRNIIDATEYNQDLSRFWTVAGHVIVTAE